MRRVLIVGATSAIAEATARLWAEEGARLYLVARDAAKLTSLADDLAIRGADRVDTCLMAAEEFDRHAAVIEDAERKLEGLDTILIAFGTLPDQKACEGSFDLTRAELETNCLSVCSLLTHAANRFERQKDGTIAVITSVAGIRGRQSNYVYGTAKGAVSIFLQGLRNRLFQAGVHVLDIKPGFVDTPMTAGFEKGFLWAEPDRVARDIHRAVRERRDLVYTPWFWAFIMLAIRLLPESIFKRLRL